MEKQHLEEYKKRLEKERRLLLAEIAQNEKPVELGTDTEDPDEETDKSEELGNQLAVAQDLKYRLDEIDVALSRIESGTYGTCEQCKKQIGKEVLDVDPESRLCENCKSKS